MIVRTGRYLAIALLAAASQAAGAVTFFSVNGAPDPGPAWFERTIVTFDAPASAGISVTSTGDVTKEANTQGVPTGDTTIFSKVNAQGRETIDWSAYTGLATVKSVSFYWGTIGGGNDVQVLNRDGQVVATIANKRDMGATTFGDASPFSNRRIYINFTPNEDITAIRIVSFVNSFEYDDVALSSAVFSDPGVITWGAGRGTPSPAALLGLPTLASVPEPATWASLLLGFGIIGLSARRGRAFVNRAA